MPALVAAIIAMLRPSKRASAPAPKASAREPAATTTAKAGAARTGTRGRDKNLVHIGRHVVHRTRKENRIEDAVSALRHIPLRRIFDDPGKCLGPMMLHSQRHGVRQKLFERRRGHDLQSLR